MFKALSVTAVAIAAATAYISMKEEPLTTPQLRTIVENMGYAPKTISEETGKFQFDVKTDSFNVPVGTEISKSGNYIWFTVSLGDASGLESKHGDLLRQNAQIQPDFFYITAKGTLMLGVAVDNRGVTPAVVKRVTDKLVADVDSTSKYWKK